MSLVNPSDVIIPNTVGTITASVKEANRHLDSIKEHSAQREIRDKNLAQYIREISSIQHIVQNRINGVPLEKLVDPARIANDKDRSKESMEETKMERAYEEWFRN